MDLTRTTVSSACTAGHVFNLVGSGVVKPPLPPSSTSSSSPLPDGTATFMRMYREARMLGPLPPGQASAPTTPASFRTPAAARDSLLHMLRRNLTGSAPAGGNTPPTPSPPHASAPTSAGVPVPGAPNTSYADNCRTLELFAAVSCPSDLVCSLCCQVGHLVEHCPRTMATPAVGELPPVCERCGGVGHETSRCPSSLT